MDLEDQAAKDDIDDIMLHLYPYLTQTEDT